MSLLETLRKDMFSATKDGNTIKADILKMVKQFLNNRRLVDLDKIQISKSNDSKNQSLNINLVSDLHYLPIEK